MLEFGQAHFRLISIQNRTLPATWATNPTASEGGLNL